MFSQAIKYFAYFWFFVLFCHVANTHAVCCMTPDEINSAVCRDTNGVVKPVSLTNKLWPMTKSGRNKPIRIRTKTRSRCQAREKWEHPRHDWLKKGREGFCSQSYLWKYVASATLLWPFKWKRCQQQVSVTLYHWSRTASVELPNKYGRY